MCAQLNRARTAPCHSTGTGAMGLCIADDGPLDERDHVEAGAVVHLAAVGLVRLGHQPLATVTAVRLKPGTPTNQQMNRVNSGPAPQNVTHTRGLERERERERERETERQRDGQRDREMDRETERWTER